MARARFYNPTTGQWEYIDQTPQGYTGPTGPMGPTGPANGPTGATGPTYSASVSSTSSTTTLSPVLTSFDTYILTLQAANLTVANPTGTSNGKRVLFIFKDNGTSRTITWGSNYVPIGVSLPTGTAVGKWMYVAGIWNSAAGAMHIIAVSMES